jgi:hypothetical protein
MTAHPRPAADATMIHEWATSCDGELSRMFTGTERCVDVKRASKLHGLMECRRRRDYSLAGAGCLRDALPAVEGGSIMIGVLGEPYTCRPAQFGVAFLHHDYITGRGLRYRVTITVTGCIGAPVPNARQVSEPLLAHLTAREMTIVPNGVPVGHRGQDRQATRRSRVRARAPIRTRLA